MSEQTEAFGRVIARLREAAGLTRYALAKRAGMSAVHLARLEQGGQRPSLASARKLAEALGVSLAEFDGCA